MMGDVSAATAKVLSEISSVKAAIGKVEAAIDRAEEQLCSKRICQKKMLNTGDKRRCS